MDYNKYKVTINYELYFLTFDAFAVARLTKLLSHLKLPKLIFNKTAIKPHLNQVC